MGGDFASTLRAQLIVHKAHPGMLAHSFKVLSFSRLQGDTTTTSTTFTSSSSTTSTTSTTFTSTSTSTSTTWTTTTTSSTSTSKTSTTTTTTTVTSTSTTMTTTTVPLQNSGIGAVITTPSIGIQTTAAAPVPPGATTKAWSSLVTFTTSQIQFV